MTESPDRPRFLTLHDVAEELATSHNQVYALVRRKQLPALKLGGRGQWRIARNDLEAFIAQAFDDTGRWIDAHPFAGEEPAEDGE